jgi:hypothetical protein
MTVNASNGAVYVVGYTNGTFGGPGVSPVYNGQSAFVARLLTANGSMQWLQTWGNSSSRNIAYSVEVSPFNGDLYAGGSSGDAELEGQSLIGAPCDLSLSRLAAGSQRRWTQLSGSIGADIIYSMDIDSFNQVWLGTLNGNSYIQLAYMSDGKIFLVILRI